MRLALANAGPLSAMWTTSSARSAISPDAVRLTRFAKDVFRNVLRSATGQRRWAEPIDTLLDLRERCSVDNWDGEGAAAISPDAFEEAITLLAALPSAFPAPETLPEPTGAIAFEWYRAPDRVYLLSVSGQKSIEFAGLFGRGNEVHGRANFEATLPKRIQEDLSGFLEQ